MTPEYRQWLAELFSPLGAVSIRRFFNIDGVYFGETMFGLVTGERIYFKTDEQSRKAFEREGSSTLTYVARNGERIVTSYWEIPERLYDEPDALAEWARRAYEVALASPTAKRKLVRRARQSGARQPARRRTRK